MKLLQLITAVQEEGAKVWVIFDPYIDQGRKEAYPIDAWKLAMTCFSLWMLVSQDGGMEK